MRFGLGLGLARMRGLPRINLHLDFSGFVRFWCTVSWLYYLAFSLEGNLKVHKTEELTETFLCSK